MTLSPTHDEQLALEAEESFHGLDRALASTAALEQEEKFVADGDREATDHEQRLINLVKHGIGETDIAAAVDRIAVGTEGLLDSIDFRKLTTDIVKKGLVSAGKLAGEMSKKNINAYKHYFDTAQTVLKRLKVIEEGLLAHGEEPPETPVFEYGVYQRFFQIGELPVTNFEEYRMALSYQQAATRYVMTKGIHYQSFVAEKIAALAKDLKPDAPEEAGAHLLYLAEQIESEWSDIWENAVIKPAERWAGKAIDAITPQNTLNEYPLRNFVALSPMLDARYLVASYPKNKSGKDIPSISEQARAYGAMLAFDKKSGVKTVTHMDTPSAVDALHAVRTCINDLNNMFVYSEQAKSVEKNIDKFKEYLKKISDNIGDYSDAEAVQYVGMYVRLISQFYETIHNPSVLIAWMSVRTAIMTASIAEHVMTSNKTIMGFTKLLSSSQGAKVNNLAPGLEEYADVVVLSDLLRKHAN